MGLSVSQKACVCFDYHIYYNHHNYDDDNVDYNNNYYYNNNNHNNFDYYNFCNKFGGNVLGEG